MTPRVSGWQRIAPVEALRSPLQVGGRADTCSVCLFAQVHVCEGGVSCCVSHIVDIGDAHKTTYTPTSEAMEGSALHQSKVLTQNHTPKEDTHLNNYDSECIALLYGSSGI